MKKILFLIVILSVGQLQAQENNKLKIKAIDYGAIGIYTNLENDGVRGFCSNLELVTNYQKNLYAFNCSLGLGITEKNNRIQDLQGFMSLDLLYGREIIMSDKITFEPYVGLGYIIQSNTSHAGENSAIGFPIRAKIFFNVNKRFAIGINPNVNINNVNTFYSTNILLRLKIKGF